MNYKNFKIEDNIIDCNISYRGGILKVDVSDLFPYIEDAIMGASQNYLGGGITGAITTGRQFPLSDLKVKDLKIYEKLVEDIKKYFYDINNGGGDDYMQNESGQTYEKVQARAVSGY